MRNIYKGVSHVIFNSPDTYYSIVLNKQFKRARLDNGKEYTIPFPSLVVAIRQGRFQTLTVISASDIRYGPEYTDKEKFETFCGKAFQLLKYISWNDGGGYTPPIKLEEKTSEQLPLQLEDRTGETNE